MVVNMKLHCGCVLDKDKELLHYIINSLDIKKLSSFEYNLIELVEAMCIEHKELIPEIEQIAICGEIILSLERTHISNIKGIAMIIKNNTSITNINLTYNKISSYELKELTESLRHNTVLRTLNLGHNYIGAEGAKDIAAVLENNYTLTTLCLGNYLVRYVGVNSIGDEGVREISNALKMNTTLTTLHLEDNNIEDEGAKELVAGIMFNSALTKLYLRRIVYAKSRL